MDHILSVNTENPTCCSSHTLAGACFNSSNAVVITSPSDCTTCLSSGYTWVEGCVVSSWCPAYPTPCSNCSTFPPNVPGYSCSYTCTNTAYNGDCAGCIQNGFSCSSHCTPPVMTKKCFCQEIIDWIKGFFR